MNDVGVGIFGQQSFGKAAMVKIGDVSENFRLFEAGWVGHPRKSDTMKVTGAEFRIAKAGKNKGKLSIKVPDTTRTVYVNRAEMDEHRNT